MWMPASAAAAMPAACLPRSRPAPVCWSWTATPKPSRVRTASRGGTPGARGDSAGRFSAVDEQLAASEHGALAGVVFDAGVSSPQLDNAERGFSFRADGPLDMRMDQRDPLTAADWLNQAGEAEIAGVIRRYGEERRARAVARRIVAARPLARTAQLAARRFGRSPPRRPASMSRPGSSRLCASTSTTSSANSTGA